MSFTLVHPQPSSLPQIKQRMKATLLPSLDTLLLGLQAGGTPIYCITVASLAWGWELTPTLAKKHGLLSLFFLHDLSAQAQVQRLLTLPSLAKAQAALWIQVHHDLPE